LIRKNLHFIKIMNKKFHSRVIFFPAIYRRALSEPQRRFTACSKRNLHNGNGPKRRWCSIPDTQRTKRTAPVKVNVGFAFSNIAGWLFLISGLTI